MKPIASNEMDDEYVTVGADRVSAESFETHARFGKLEMRVAALEALIADHEARLAILEQRTAHATEAISNTEPRRSPPGNDMMQTMLSALIRKVGAAIVQSVAQSVAEARTAGNEMRP